MSPVDDSDLEEARVRYAMRAVLAAVVMHAIVAAGRYPTDHADVYAHDSVATADALMEALGPIP